MNSDGTGTIMLFGSSDLRQLPAGITEALDNYNKACWSFVIGDGTGADEAFHHYLSMIGARERAHVVTAGTARNNRYDFHNIVVDEEYNKDTEEVIVKLRDTGTEVYRVYGIANEADLKANDKIRQAADRTMLQMCDFAICLWNGRSTTDMNIIQLANMRDIKCYVFKQGE